MKGYEDLVAGLTLLVVVLIGGYFYLDSQVIVQKKAETAKIEVKAQRSEKTMFEVAVKQTD